LGDGLIPPFIELLQLVGAIGLQPHHVGVFATPVIMMDEESEARAAAGYEPLQHLEITVGVPEGRDGPPSDPALDADRLPSLSSMKSRAGSFTSSSGC